MFPNPQDALPLPPRPSLEQYKKQAKDLVKACRAGDEDAIADWTVDWLDSLARTQDERTGTWVRHLGNQVATFARDRMRERCAVTNAQFVIARSHGFLSWPKFAQHLDSLPRGDSSIARFESAADAIVNGDEARVRALLREDPRLARARSTREHRATLLHYVSANGVEGYRQKTPPNIVRITEILLDAGAEVDADADVYGSGCTALGLVATSSPPRGAGVQLDLIDLLLRHGATMDKRGLAGRTHSLVFACLANGCPEAARFLAERGAPLDFLGAAGIGRLDRVRELMGSTSKEDLQLGFIWACAYGRNDVVEFLLDSGIDIGAQDKDGQTGLHWAVIIGRLDTVKLLLRHGAPLETRNVYGGTVLGQAVWSAAHHRGDPSDYVEIIETLIAAGAKIRERHPPINKTIDELLAKYGSRVDESLSFTGDEPLTSTRSRKKRS